MSSAAAWQRLSRVRGLPPPLRTIARNQFHRRWAEEILAQTEGEDVARLTPPPEEHVYIPAIWLTELYTPTTIDELRRGMSRLLGRARHHVDRDSIMKGISAGRRAGRGWMNLPTVISPASRVFAPNSVEDDLPDGVDHVELQLVTVTSSITALVAGFFLTADRSEQLNNLLAEKPAPKLRRSSYGSGFSIVYAETAREEDIENWRYCLQDSLSEWLRSRLPGTLAKLSRSPLPAVELVVPEVADPWVTDLGHRLGYLDVLGLGGRRRLYWENTRFTGLRVQEHQSLLAQKKSRSALTLSARRSVIAEIHKSRGDHYESTYSELQGAAAILGTYNLGGLCTRWGLTVFLRELDHDLSQLRDLIQGNARNRSGKWLEDLRIRLLKTSLDGRIVVSDIIASSQSSHRIVDDAEFREEGEKSDQRLFSEVMREHHVSLGNRLMASEADLRALLSTNAELMIASQNLQLSRRIFWLTIISVMAALVAAWAAVIAIRPDASSSPVKLEPGPIITTATSPGGRNY